MKPLATILLAAPLLAGCIIIDADEDDFTVDYDRSSSAGTVYGADIAKETITFRVTSNGCTDESYFDVDVDRLSNSRYRVTIDRDKTDTCEADMPDGTIVSYSFSDLGLPGNADVVIGNPVRHW